MGYEIALDCWLQNHVINNIGYHAWQLTMSRLGHRERNAADAVDDGVAARAASSAAPEEAAASRSSPDIAASWIIGCDQS